MIPILGHIAQNLQETGGLSWKKLKTGRLAVKVELSLEDLSEIGMQPELLVIY